MAKDIRINSRSGEEAVTDGRQLDRSKEYDKTVEHVRLRVPAGWKDRMAAHVFENGDKYNSVNDMIVKLIRQELGIED